MVNKTIEDVEEGRYTVHSQLKKGKNDVQNVSYLETRSKAGEDNKIEQMPVDTDNQADSLRGKDSNFNYKCICDWSKDDEFGFISNTECPVHGKQSKESLKDCVDVKKPQESEEDLKVYRDIRR